MKNKLYWWNYQQKSDTIYFWETFDYDPKEALIELLNYFNYEEIDLILKTHNDGRKIYESDETISIPIGEIYRNNSILNI